MSPDPEVLGLKILIQLSRRVRNSESPEEIGFVAVNESKQLIQYRQSLLWSSDKGVFSVSGVPEPDYGSPYIQWLTSLCKKISVEETSRLTSQDFPQELGRSWSDWVPAYAVVSPLKSKEGGTDYFLILFREEPWQDHELSLVSELSSIYAYGFDVYKRREGLLRKTRKSLASNLFRVLLTALLIAAIFIPVRMSVQGQAEIVPRDPFVLRSPLDTVIDQFHVKPNQQVTEGQLLFVFEETNLRSKYEVAQKAFEVATEEYRQAGQIALVDDSFRSELRLRQGKMEEKATELAYFRDLLSKTQVKSPRSGIVVFSEQSDWVGKNVAIGERVLTIADQDKVEILIKLPIDDFIDIDVGSPVRLYLSSDPQNPIEGKVRYAAYNPEVSAAGISFYRIKATLAPGSTLPRIGLTGTARIYGETVTLGYFLFRRPIISLRQFFGW